MKTMAFILKGYPRVSETFIAQEIHLLEQMGFKIEILSMRRAREPERQPIVSLIQAPVTYIPEYVFSKDFGTLLMNGLKCLGRYPTGFLSTFVDSAWRSLRTRDDSPIKRFIQAAWLVGDRGIGSTSPIEHLHSHFAHSPTELALALSKITGLPFTISAHAKDIYTIPAAELTRRINACRMIMTCTGYNYEFMRALPGVDRDKIHQVYHGIDLQNFKPSGAHAPGSNLTNFLSVGRLVPKKGYGDIFEALRRLRDQGVDFRYDIFGSGELKKDLVALRERLGLQDRIVFHDTATHPQIIARMDRKGIFICGSRLGEDGDRDGIPNTLAEAMAMELPVVATAVSGIPELVQDGISGILVQEKDPAALADAIQRVLVNPEASATMGRQARERVANVFNCEIWIHRCADLLRPFAEDAR